MQKITRLKIKLALILSLLIAFIIAFAPFISITSASAVESQAQYQYFNSRMRCMETFRARMLEQAEELTVQYKVPVPTSAPYADSFNYDVREGSVYTGDGNRLFILQEANLVIASNGDIITIDDTNASSQNGSLAIYYNEQSQEFIDGANRNLAIFLNSRLDRNELRSGGRYTRTIRLDTTIYLVNYRLPNGRYNEIFVSITPYRTGWWIFANNRFRVYDMNGRVLDYNRIGFPQPAPWWHPAWLHIRQFNRVRNMFDTMERFVLGDLLHFATIHPWSQILEPLTGYTVITEDGRDIRVNPRTMQLTDFFGFALFNERNGLPILFHGNDIITTDGEQQRIENAVLLEAMTVQDLLHRGVDFHMHIVPTPFGNFDVPVVNLGSFYNEDWRLMNGDSTEGVTIEHRDSQNLNTWQSFWEGLSNFGGRAGGILRTFLIIGGVIAGLVVMFAVVWVFKYFFPSKQKNGTTIIMRDGQSNRRNENEKENH